MNGTKRFDAKNLEFYPDVFADIINALLYKGEPVVKSEELMAAPTENLYLGKEGDIRNLYQDISKYVVENGKIKAQYSVENEIQAKKKMVLRKAGYEGAVYRQLFDGKVPEKIKRYIDDIRLHVFNMRKLPKEVRELFHSDMRIVVDYLAEGAEYTPSKKKIVHLEELLLLLSKISDDDRYKKLIQLVTQSGQKGGMSMCELLDKYEKRGREKGEEKLACLVDKLFNAGRVKDLQEIVKNIEYREQLYREYGIV